MQPLHYETHWIYKTAQISRIGWFIFHILMLGLIGASIPFLWLQMTLLFAAFLLPQWSENRVKNEGRSHYPLLEFIFSGLFLIVACFLDGKYSSFLALPSLCAGLYSRPGKERWILWGGFSLVPILAYLAIGLNQMGMGVIDGVFFFGIGVMIAKVIETENKMKVLLEENHRKNLLLEEYAKQIEKVTLLEERNRLARELHDTVGHTFTSVIMGLDAVSYMLEASPQKAKEQVDRLGTVMRRSLDEVRDYIHQISPASDRKEELTEQLRNVANNFAKHTNIEIKFESFGDPANISEQGEIAFIRCLQESLTNAVRHGNAQRIEASLCQQSSQIVLKVKDHGVGMDEITYGFGLNGMKERMESLQGGLTIESEPSKGTVVSCFVPIKNDFEKGGIE